MTKIVRWAAMVLLVPIVVAGCSVGGGTSNETFEPTLGQQLIDLKRALDTGAISRPEYDELKAQLKQVR